MKHSKYTVTVNYDISLERAIKPGKYDWVNSDINDKNFKSKESGKKKLDIHLFGFDRDITSKEVINILKKKGYRVATLRELLALGAAYPELQIKYYINSLGSKWRSPSGDLLVPYLGRLDSGRDLYLGWFGNDWGSRWRFAAVQVDYKPLNPSLTLKSLDARLKKLENRLEKSFNSPVKKEFSTDEEPDNYVGNGPTTEPYLCRSYYDDHNKLRDCTCGKCGDPKQPSTLSEVEKECRTPAYYCHCCKMNIYMGDMHDPDHCKDPKPPLMDKLDEDTWTIEKMLDKINEIISYLNNK